VAEVGERTGKQRQIRLETLTLGAEDDARPPVRFHLERAGCR